MTQPEPSSYRQLPPAACPASHPASVLVTGTCVHCHEMARCFGIWLTRCGVCGSQRVKALALMEREGLICPICLPMQLDRLGQPRQGEGQQS